MRPPAALRPGKPEAPAWRILAFLAVLFLIAAGGWVLLAGIGWLIWAYTAVGVAVVVGLVVGLIVVGLIRRAVRR